ncbi:MAG: glutamine amidotransferase [Acidobacteriota bacterium]
MDGLVQFFFKYKPHLFAKGRLAFDAGPAAWIWVLLTVTLLGLILFLYRFRPSAGPPSRPSWNIVGLALLRICTVLVLMIILCQPVLRVSTVRPRENLAAVLVDDSRSMSIEDTDGQSRLEAVKQALDPQKSPLMDELNKRFQTQLFRFSRDVEHLRSAEALQPSGTGTGLESALDAISKELSSAQLASVLVFSDGADNLSRNLSAVISQFQSRKIPVNVCAVGQTEIGKDIELSQVSAPLSVLPESITSAVVSVRSHGYAGKTAVLEVKEAGKVVNSKSITLPRDGETQVIELELSPKGKGLKSYDLVVIPQSDERITVNNSQNLLLNVEDLTPKILFLEGSPRWEFKFIRQALYPEKNLQLVSLLRTSGNKFYRQGIESEDNLASGFPTTREELFTYQGLILGSVEASFFSAEQLKIMADFVGERGGGLLMVGGRSSFDAGKYAGTPVAAVLPVVLGERSVQNSFVAEPMHMKLTAYGKSHLTARLSIDQAENEKRWSALPEIGEFNWISNIKPGASLLAYGEKGKSKPVLLAVHRYGRGRAAAFTAASSWRWQMEMPHEDDSHETFWRQMLRWLVASTPPMVSLELDRSVFQEEDRVGLRVEVNDATFTRLNDASVVASVNSPSGKVTEIPLQWLGIKDGIYQGEYRPVEKGLYRVTVTASRKGTEIGVSQQHFLVADSNLEFYNAAQNRDLLTRLATETGGRYYSLADLKDLPEEMSYIDRPNSVPQTLPLWDMPILFLTICSCLIAEWFLRKRQGLA